MHTDFRKWLKLIIPLVLVVICGSIAYLASLDPNDEQRLKEQVERWQTQVPGDVELIRDVEYGKGGDRPLKLDILRPKTPPTEPMPVVVFIHGGGWRGGVKERGIPLLVPYAQKGYFCATVDYRLSLEAPFPAQIEDCKCAIRFLRAKSKSYNIDPNHIGVWGISAGGHLVALLGTSGGVKSLEGKGGWRTSSSKVQAVCDWFGPTDLLNIAEDRIQVGIRENDTKNPLRSPVALLLGGPIEDNKEKAAQASPITFVSKDDPPFFICHGDQDQLVPPNQSVRLDAALRKVGVESTLIIVKGAGHGFDNNPEVEKMTTEFFDKHLR